MILLLILSRVTLLILLISDLVGLISPQVGLYGKFGLWSFSYKCVLVSSSVYSVIDTQLCCDFFVFCMDVPYGARMGLFVGLSDVLL